jgi:hypothetical protein
LKGVEMDYRIHHQETYYSDSFLLEGINLLAKDGITVESLIENFSTQLNRLRLEIDMEGLSPYSATPLDHPLKLAAEYMLEEMLLPPFIPYKHGIPIHAPMEYAAKATLSEEDDFSSSYLDDAYNICSLAASSEEYSYAAYMLGFVHTLKVISIADNEKILKLFDANYYAADHIEHSIISDDLWITILLKDPRTIPNAPAHLVKKELYDDIFGKNTKAFESITWIHEGDVYCKLQDLGFTHGEYLKIIEKQTPVCGLFTHRLSDEEFSNLLDINGVINFSNLFDDLIPL